LLVCQNALAQCCHAHRPEIRQFSAKVRVKVRGKRSGKHRHENHGSKPFKGNYAYLTVMTNDFVPAALQ
jgi:hypothetical protein